MDLGLKFQKTDVGIRINILEILCMLIFRQNGQRNFSTQTCPKMELGLKIQKADVGIRISILEILCLQMNFSTQICREMDLGLEIQKTNVRIKISILEIPCVPIFRQNGHFFTFLPKFAKKLILKLEFKKFKSRFGITTPKILFSPIFS